MKTKKGGWAFGPFVVGAYGIFIRLLTLFFGPL
jgi:hypothetical protein